MNIRSSLCTLIAPAMMLGACALASAAWQPAGEPNRQNDPQELVNREQVQQEQVQQEQAQQEQVQQAREQAPADGDADGDASGEARLESIVDALGSEDFGVREVASDRLERGAGITLEMIEQRLARGGLTAEQRTRLDVAAKRRFSALPRAGLGVQFGAPRRAEGVELGAVLENFPASDFLRAGDVVVEIDGVPIRNTGEMGSFILSYQPGETLRMTIDRPVPRFPGLEDMEGVPEGIDRLAEKTERISLDVPLGSYDELNTGAPISADRLDAAYTRYQFRRGLIGGGADGPEGGPAVVGGGVTPLDWLRAEGYDHEKPSVPGGSFESVSAWRRLSFAGQPDSWIAEIDLRRGDANAMARRVLRAVQANSEYDELEEALAAYRAMVDRVVQIDGQLFKMREEVGVEEARLERIKEERDDLNDALAELAAEIEQPVGASSSAEVGTDG